jgi:hypothetical protein
MEPTEPSGETWSLPWVLDLVGIALAGIVAAQVIGAIVAGLDLSVPHNVSGIPGGPLPNLVGSTPLYQRLDQATDWASPGAGFFLLATLGLIVLPRIVWDLDEQHGSGGWARPAVLTAGVLGGLLAVAAGLGAALVFWQPGLGSGPGFQDVDIPTLVGRITGVGMGLLVAVLSGLALRVVTF